MSDALKVVADYWWAVRLKELCRYAAGVTKIGERTLTPSDIKQLEEAKHYIELALKNDQYWKAERAA